MSESTPNTVELISFSGGDLSHANAAWVSTSTEMSSSKLKQVPDLLLFLATHEHGTPFEHSQLSFRIRSEMATHIQFLKHRHASINSESARYKELLKDTYYVPADWPEEIQQELSAHYEQCHKVYHSLTSNLSQTLGRKRAKETARFVLPYANQISYIFSCNFRSFIHFLNLRATEDAQREIADLAWQMVKLVKNTKDFDQSLKAFGY